MIVRCLLAAALLMLVHTEFSAGQSSDFEQRRQALKSQQEETRQQIQSLESQIETYRGRLQLASRRYEEMFRQHEELTRLIALQDERIRVMEREQCQIEREMALVEENLTGLQRDLDNLIEKYQQTLIYLYKHGRSNELALILSSDSVNQLLVRSYYLSRFDAHRRIQETEIRNKQQEYEQARADLEETRQRNSSSLARIQVEKTELAEREEQYKVNVELLQRDRNQLQEQLDRVERDRRELDDVLTRLVSEEEEIQRAEEERLRRLAEAREIEDDEARAEAVARYSQPLARTAAVSDEELRAFEISFRDSRGQLPWPVEEGTITERFGERVHPVFRTRTNNPGIDIAAPPRSTVRTVHEGYVFAVQPLPGFGDVVMVNHGRYITVYGNLSEVYVSRGHVLNRGSVIGLSGDENSIRGEVLFFLIRDGSNNVNPETWIQRAPAP